MKVLLYIIGIYLSGCVFNIIVMKIQEKKQGYPVESITSSIMMVLSWTVYLIILRNYILDKLDK